MVTKKIKHKDATGNLHEYDIGVEAKNVTQDKDHQFVTAEEKEAWNKKQDRDGDASSLSVKFQQASTRSNIKTGEKLNVIFGKIAKWFADFKSHVFLDLVQNATTKDTTRAVSAAVAAELQKQIDSLNSALTYGNSYEPKWNDGKYNRACKWIRHLYPRHGCSEFRNQYRICYGCDNSASQRNTVP